ncbi:hypothetical protein LCGC14_2333580 [marine sediment metagenome]|uniref:Uncharacterized protein n=1 Tax=marine sediment metagenome TaxID=412755 RepID=A0A0F9ERT9_9ZZZZ
MMFKIGDRVKDKGDCCCCHGEIKTIREVDGDTCKFDTGECSCMSHHLELVLRPKPDCNQPDHIKRAIHEALIMLKGAI